MQFDISKILQRIEIKLAEIGMPKQEFYARSGISSASFSQWNTGAHKPTIKKLKDAADVLGTSVEYLLYGEESPAQYIKKAPTSIAESERSRQIAARISEIVCQLYPETQESCLQYFESLLALQNAAQGRDIQG